MESDRRTAQFIAKGSRRPKEASMTESRWLANYDDGVPTSLKPYPDRTLVDYLRESAEMWPDRPALLFKGARVTYGQLQNDSDAFAAALASMGVRPGDRVAICLPNCPQFVVAEFGAWKVGAIACPFNPTYTERETEDALQATGAETAVVLNRFYGKLKSIQSRTSLKRIIATGIKDYLPWHLRLAYTFFKEGKEGERIKLGEGDVRIRQLIARYRGASVPDAGKRWQDRFHLDQALFFRRGGFDGRNHKTIRGPYRRRNRRRLLADRSADGSRRQSRAR